MDIRDLSAAAAKFQAQLHALKLANSRADFAWYPYDTFSVFPVLNRLLKQDRRKLLSLADTGLVLDVGCGDGGMSFFLESCGCRVLAIDSANQNYNRTAGFKTLARELNSSVELVDHDIDSGLALQGRTFGLALCLGVLYHLKNPYLLLETLARHSRYCLLSTRIAQITVRGTKIAQDPVAYLLDPCEANRDASNYWIFSEAGLRRILYRTGWDICDYETTGFERGSNPAAQDRDERAFCLLASKLADPWLGCDLDGGWHAMEDGAWRWTERSFSVRLRSPRSSGALLRLRFKLPEVVLRATGPVHLHATVGGERLPDLEYNLPGDHVYEQPISSVSLRDDNVPVRFELDKAMPPTGPEVRELGVQVIFWSITDDTPSALFPISLQD
jgi:SAM-dependent methyltransferase